MAADEKEIAPEEGSDGLTECSAFTGLTTVTSGSAGSGGNGDTAAAASGARVGPETNGAPSAGF